MNGTFLSSLCLTLALNYVCALRPCLAEPAAATPTATAKTLSDLRVKAEKGDSRAQLEYAKAIAETSKDEARTWAQRAADQGLGEAWFWLGYTMAGDSTPFYEKAAELRYPEAFSYLLDNILFRAESKADVVKAKKFGDIARADGISFGYDTAAMLDTIDHCFEAGSPQIPAADEPSQIEKKTLETEDCSFDAGDQPDYVTYRKCLLSEAAPDYHAMAEIYANGWGVQRDPMLAIAFLCHSSEVPAELKGMVKELYGTKALKSLPEPFTFCAHITSGLNMGRCAAADEANEEGERQSAIETLKAKWSKEQKAAFDELQKAAEAFFEERSGSEVDLSGTARAALSIAEKSELRSAFIEELQTVEKGSFPAELNFDQADKELNAVYGRIMKSSKSGNWGTVTKDSIKLTQKKWLKYRDAWATFCFVRNAKAPISSWKALLTNKRADQLAEFADTK